MAPPNGVGPTGHRDFGIHAFPMLGSCPDASGDFGIHAATGVRSQKSGVRRREFPIGDSPERRWAYGTSGDFAIHAATGVRSQGSGDRSSRCLAPAPSGFRHPCLNGDDDFLPSRQTSG